MTRPVVIIGSGLSGSGIAAELLGHHVPITIVDAGPAGTRRHLAADPHTAAMIEPDADPQFQPYSQNSAASHYGRSAGIRLRVGGRSLYWRGIALRLESYALASWPPELQAALLGDGAGNIGLYAEVERQLEAWVGAPCDAPRTATESRLSVRLQSLGFPSARPTPRAVRSRPDGCWSAYSPFAEIPPELVRAQHCLMGLAVRPDGEVDLQLRGPKGGEACRAAAVVLCAGTVENARIVSRIRKQNSAFPIVDHHAQGWLCAVDRHRSDHDHHAASILVCQDDKSRINAFLERHRIGGHDILDAWSMGEQIPTSRALLCFGDEPCGPRFDVKLTQEDEAVLAAQTSFLASLADAMDLKLDDSMAPRASGFNEALKTAISVPGVAIPYHCPLGTSDHESCALPIGGGAVDINAELRDFPSVFVAGPCLFPRAGAANPSLTTLALSRYVARRIMARMQ
jgi:glycine/D-amino acid oxidase-like deaminating enzyme